MADARAEGGAFRSLTDFARRVDHGRVNKKALECLASAGAFDEVEPDRAQAFAAIEPMLAMSQRRAEERAFGQVALFGESESAPLEGRRPCPGRCGDRLRREFDAVGFFLSGPSRWRPMKRSSSG